MYARSNMINKDYIYGSTWLAKGQQFLLKHGKKESAELHLYRILKKLKLEYGIQPQYFFIDYLQHHQIVIELRSYRKSSVFYDVPFPVALKRQYLLGFRLIANTLYKKAVDTYNAHLYNEFNKFFDTKISILKKYIEDLLNSASKSRPHQQYRW